MATPKGKKNIPQKYAATAWGKNAGGFQEVTVPSGQLVLVKPPNLDRIIASGLLDKLDTLGVIVSRKVRRAQGLPPAESASMDVDSLIRDPEKLRSVLAVVDKTVCEIVVQPSISSTIRTVTEPSSGQVSEEEIPWDERDPEAIYVDSVSLEDRMFLFNYAVSGVKDLESFRHQLGKATRDLADEPEDESKPESDPPHSE